jgi:DNA-binding SARP family transcriptional activator
VLPGGPGRWLCSDRRTLGWRTDAAIWVDACEFEKPSHHKEEMVALYAGDFLPRVEHDWVFARREYYRRRACASLADLLHDGSRSCTERLRFAEHLLTLDPWREDVFRESLRLRAACGDRAGAVVAYRAFCKELRTELDIEPMPETVRCFEMLVRGEHLPKPAEIRGLFATTAAAIRG